MIIKYNYANMLNNLIDCCKIKKKWQKSGKKWQIYKKSGKKVEKWKSGKKWKKVARWTPCELPSWVDL